MHAMSEKVCLSLVNKVVLTITAMEFQDYQLAWSNLGEQMCM